MASQHLLEQRGSGARHADNEDRVAICLGANRIGLRTAGDGPPEVGRCLVQARQFEMQVRLAGIPFQGFFADLYRGRELIAVAQEAPDLQQLLLGDRGLP